MPARHGGRGTPKQLFRSCLLLATLGLAACAAVPRIPVDGEFNGAPVRTTVDSEPARYYLEQYSRGRVQDPALHAEIDALHARHRNRAPDRESLRDISTRYSVDFAALFLADHLLRDPCNRPLNTSFARLTDAAAPPDPTRAAQYRVLFVPGWDYQATGHFTGADLAAPRALATRSGLENHFVQVPPNGSIEDSAAVVAAAVRGQAGSGQELILAGPSSAGPAIHLALGTLLRPDELGTVKAWLNLGGLLQGTPLFEQVDRVPQRWILGLFAWYQGWEMDALRSMGATAGRERFAKIPAIPGLLTINYLGIPLSGQISRFTRERYPLLRPHGPNDGITLATDAIAPDSHTVVAFGSDHFFAEDPQIHRKSLALINLVIALLAEGLPAECH